jgi:hypothetical protein
MVGQYAAAMTLCRSISQQLLTCDVHWVYAAARYLGYFNNSPACVDGKLLRELHLCSPTNRSAHVSCLQRECLAWLDNQQQGLGYLSLHVAASVVVACVVCHGVWLASQ